jgi:transposase-like protein
MNTRTILVLSTALLFSILDPAAGQEQPKPAPETLDVPGLPGPVAAPKKKRVGGPPGAGNVPGAGVPTTLPAIPGFDVIPGAAPGPEPKPIPRAIPSLEPIPGDASVGPIKREPSARTGPEIIREAKLKVLRKHYEETLSETIQLEKAALSASLEERSKMEAKATAMRGFLGKLEADLNALAKQSGTTRKSSGLPSVPRVPGLDSPPEAEIAGGAPGDTTTGAGVPGLPGEGVPGGTSPGGYLVPKARAQLEKVKELEKSGLTGKLDVIKAETRLKWAEAHAVGDLAGAARATRDGARQRLEVLQTLFAGGVVSAEEIDEVRRELRAADADLRIQLEATREAGSEGTPGAPPAARK